MGNGQALGYMLLVCREIGLYNDLVRKIKRAMYYQFDINMEEEDKLGYDWYNNLDD